MKLDRNIKPHVGKYGLIKNRKVEDIRRSGSMAEACKINDALFVLIEAGVLDYGNTPETEFFVIRLKDKYAGQALSVYGTMATHDDPEYGHEVLRLADRAGGRHPNCKRPD